MNQNIKNVIDEIQPLREKLKNHELYESLKSIEDIKVFMESHVYAVWDFMSLLKALQNLLTCTKIPWTPNLDSKSARLINQIIVDEESDLNYNGEPKSHFEMYLEAMEEIQASTLPINDFINRIKEVDTTVDFINNYNIDSSVQSFLNFSFKTIEGRKSHEIAAAFTFGREEIIPDMFIEIIEQTEKSKKVSLDKINYYLQRHIEQAHIEKNPNAKVIVLEDLVLPSHVQENEDVFGDIKEEKSEIGENIKDKTDEMISETGGKDSEKEIRTLFQCPRCDSSFFWKQSLNKHIATVHKKEKSYNCSICNCEFSDNSYLQRHIEQAHEEKNLIEKNIDLEDLVLTSHVEENDEVTEEKSEISENVMKTAELKYCIEKSCEAEDFPSIDSRLLDHMANCCEGLVLSNNRKRDDWEQCLKPYLEGINGANDETITSVVNLVHSAGIADLTPDKVDPEDEEEDLCNAQFSLAYGTRVLLHQTPFRVKIGRKYGLVGPNGAGKSTLMKSIAGGNLQGFPTHLITVYVECEIIGEKADMTVLEYIMSDEKVKQCNCSEESVKEMLTSMGFGVSRTAAAIDAGVTTLSGGWRMKLALSRAMLLNPDMLLLDEPTNHLDMDMRQALTIALQDFGGAILLISHDRHLLANTVDEFLIINEDESLLKSSIIKNPLIKFKEFIGNFSFHLNSQSRLQSILLCEMVLLFSPARMSCQRSGC